MRHFNHHIGDYAAATQHLSFVEDAAYHRMMRLYYQTEKPLLSDLKALARVLGARTKEEKEAVATIANEFFTLEADGWHQRRCDAEIAAFLEKSSKASEAGRKGGRPRRETKPLNSNETPEASASVSESIRSTDLKPPTTHQPLPTTHEREEPVAEAALVIPAAAAADDGDLTPPGHLDRSAEGQAFAIWVEVAKANGWDNRTLFLPPHRRPAMASILRLAGGLSGWRSTLESVPNSKFLHEPDGHTKWWFDLDWLLKPENFTRLMEGRYDQRHRNENQGTADRSTPSVHDGVAAAVARRSVQAGG